MDCNSFVRNLFIYYIIKWTVCIDDTHCIRIIELFIRLIYRHIWQHTVQIHTTSSRFFIPSQSILNK